MRETIQLSAAHNSYNSLNLRYRGSYSLACHYLFRTIHLLLTSDHTACHVPYTPFNWLLQNYAHVGLTQIQWDDQWRGAFAGYDDVTRELAVSKIWRVKQWSRDKTFEWAPVEKLLKLVASY